MDRDGRAGRMGPAVIGTLFVLGGVALLGQQLGWWTVDLSLLGPAVLVVLGALFIVGAFAGWGCGWGSWDRRDAKGRAEGAQEDEEGAAMGRYWMVVMALFFFVLAGIMAARSLGVAEISYAVAGPFFLVAVGGMFVLRALAQRRQAEQGPGGGQTL